VVEVQEVQVLVDTLVVEVVLAAWFILLEINLMLYLEKHIQ
jgi:hypothetical protein